MATYLEQANDFEFILNYLSIRHPWISEAQFLRNRAAYMDVAHSM